MNEKLNANPEGRSDYDAKVARLGEEIAKLQQDITDMEGDTRFPPAALEKVRKELNEELDKKNIELIEAISQSSKEIPNKAIENINDDAFSNAVAFEGKQRKGPTLS